MKYRIDSRGRPQPIRKSTRSEMDRRDVWIARLHHRGHTKMEIASALDVSDSLVSERLIKLGLGGPRRYKGRGPVVGPCPWRDADMPAAEQPPPVSRWRQSRIVGMAQMLNDEYRESNFANILANQATEAEESGDKAWLMEALATFSAAIEKLERARRVLTDDDYREACRDTLEGVEQMRLRNPPLRAVR